MIKQIYIGGYDDNFSYFVSDKEGREIALVDPGNIRLLEAEINQDRLIPKMVLITHSHFDHVEAVREITEKCGIPVYMHSNARGRVEVPEEMTVFVEDGEIIKIGNLNLKVMFTPGHIDDAVCYHIDGRQAEDGVPKLLTGDTLFVEGCGRADLPNSNVEDLYESLRKIKALPDKTMIFSGHDYGSSPVSTLAFEKKHNKYLKCKSIEEFRKVRSDS